MAESRGTRSRRSAATVASEAISENASSHSGRRLSKRVREPSVESDSSLSSLSDEAPQPKRTRAKSANAPRINVTELDDNELFIAEASIEEATENWVVNFQGEPSEALALLVTFLLRLSGSDAKVDSEKVMDTEHAEDTLEAIQAEFSQSAVAQYPIVARSKNMRSVRKHAESLVDRLINDAGEAEILQEVYFLGTLQTWLVTLSQSSLRSFRHTGTLVAMWVLYAFSAQLEQVRENHDVAVRQRDAEARKAEGSRSRMTHSAQKIEQLDVLRDTLVAQIDELASNVFTPRCRDVDAAIRIDCIQQLGVLLTSFPAQYMQAFYLQHLNTALSDPDTHVRLSALRDVHGVCTAENMDALAVFAETSRKRIVEMALYDMDLSVRTVAFSVLEAMNKHAMLDNEQRSTLAIHIFDIDTKIRVAAASFLVSLLSELESSARIQQLAALLVQYNAQLEKMGSEQHVPPSSPTLFALVQPRLGRISIALEAVWDATDSVHSWQPYIDLALDEKEQAEQESAIVEMLAAAVRLTKDRVTEEEVSPIEACSTALMTALPKLLAKFSADAPRIADLLLIPQHMDLNVYHESRNVDAFERLWEDVCAHFMRHAEPLLLHNAADSLRHLAAAPVAVSTGSAKLGALQETVLDKLQGTLHERTIDTTLFTEDDVHIIQASLARLCALMKAMDASAALDGAAEWHIVVQLARRGRLMHAQEQDFACLALQTLSLYLFWRAKQVLDAPDPAQIETVGQRRDELLSVFAELMALEGEGTRSVQEVALQNTCMIFTLFFSVQTLEGEEQVAQRLQLAPSDSAQQNCAHTMQSLLEHYLATFRAESEQNVAVNATQHAQRKVPRNNVVPGASPALLETGLVVCAAASPYVAALRVGAFGVAYAATLLRYYAYLNASFDALCHELVSVLRDDGLHAKRGWLVCETILDALKQSFGLHLLYADEASEAHFAALSRQLANATMVRGPGFSVVEAIDADAMVTLHVAGIQQVLQYIIDGTCDQARAVVFFKGLSNLLSTVTPADAIKIHSVLHQRFAAAHVEANAREKQWDPYYSYEKRLLNLAAKDPKIVKEADHVA
ncbi:hypothetical protein MVES_003333 [Malassezia vespertilionis]|uniref:SCD domain-containing protein n=1 Tax=Malassezia vespertilionis TaxID=2020962 RepID=A0A2N1J7H7_9BASI|nr:hypothetical protein MVES_003333 [Malassezia vespertilionis]